MCLKKLQLNNIQCINQSRCVLCTLTHQYVYYLQTLISAGLYCVNVANYVTCIRKIQLRISSQIQQSLNVIYVYLGVFDL